MIAIADTSFVIAVSISTDRKHSQCLSVYQQHEKILLPEAALSEIAFMLNREGGNRATPHFLRSLPNARRYEIAQLASQDYTRSAEILEKYSDLRLDFVDAAIVALAERLNVQRILTLDQRDFRILQAKHVEHFEILP